MATNKKSVLLYCDIIHTVKELTDEEAGRLFKHYLNYVNDLNPEPPDKLTQIVFEPIKQTLKRDLKKWETKSERNSLIAKEGWKKRKDANASESIKMYAKNADIDKVIVIDKVIDKDINNNSVLEIWFKDLENSTLIDRIAMDYKLTTVKVKSMLVEFKPKMDVSYRTYADLANHFKNWVPKNLPKQTTKRTPLT